MTSRSNTSFPANNLSSITYNQLNLLVTLNANGLSVTYTYDATGEKIKKTVSGSVTVNNEYIDGIHYEGGTLKFVNTAEGRVVRISATNYSFEYMLGDHLGNGRVYFDINAGAARKVQEMDYYAFGLGIPRYLSGTENKYQYNGKEKQDQERWYDYGMRFYDPLAARWMVVDPMAERFVSYSPYNFVLDNPLKYIDPDGNDVLSSNAFLGGAYGKAF